MDFIRGKNTLYSSRDFDSKYDFGLVKLPGLSRNRPLIMISPKSVLVNKNEIN